MLLLVFSSTAFATTFAIGAHYVSHMRPASLHMLPLDPNFSPNAPVGGVPFCKSRAYGTILCYPPHWLNKAYGFPTGFDGSGSTITIVDAFGSPTAQADLNMYTTTFGLPAASITILCGPTWSGASTDKCPAFDPSLPIQQLCFSPGWWEETTLDLQMSHAMAPGAKIVLVVSDDCFDTSFNSAELAVVQQAKYMGSIMSQSFGEPDVLVGCLDFPCTIRDPTIKADADHIYQLAAQNQWTVLASSGDDGANEALSAVGTTELTPSWPASNPFNTAVGGTQGNPYGGQYGPPACVPDPNGPFPTCTAPPFSCEANAVCNTGLLTISGGANGCGTATRPGFPSGCTPVGYGGEASWQEFTTFGVRTSSGGGVSSLYPLPTYQEGTVPVSYTTLFGHTVTATGRLNPDLSLNAPIHGGVLIFVGFLGPSGSWAVFGGTSASSPGFAAVIAVANQQQGGPVGFINPTVYAMKGLGLYAASFHDITIGNNSDTNGTQGVDGYVSTAGYDLTTGWGTPKVAAFITNLLSTLQQLGQA